MGRYCEVLHARFGVPLINGHCVTRDFGWVTEYNSMLHPTFFSQCMKNASVPEWTAVENAVTKGICNALRGITVVPIEEVETLALSIVRDAKARYTVRSGQFLRFFRIAEIRKQLALMPESWVFGQFDKGTTVLHGTCRGYFYSQFQQNIFKSPKRFHELERFVTPREGSQQLYALIVGTAHRFFIRTHLPQASVTSGLQVYVDDPQKPPWPTLPRIMRLSPDFKHIIRKVLGTAKLKLQGWARGPVPTAPGKRRRLVKHIRTLVRGLPIPGNTHPKTRGSPTQGHMPRTLTIYRDQPPRVLSKVELVPADVMHQCIVPYICNQKEAMTMFCCPVLCWTKASPCWGHCASSDWIKCGGNCIRYARAWAQVVNQ